MLEEKIEQVESAEEVTEVVEEMVQAEPEIVEKVEEESVKEDNSEETKEVFTQEDVTNVVQNRVNRLKEKHAKELEELKKEIEASQAKHDEVDTVESQKQIQELSEELSRTQAENCVLKNGVKPEFIKDTLALAELREGESLDEKIAAVLEAYPHFTSQGTVGQLQIGSRASNEEPNEVDIRAQRMAERMGLKSY